MFRIALCMTATCALGAAVLGGVFIWTDRYQEAARTTSERQAVTQMLGAEASAPVIQIHQYLDAAHQHVIYRASDKGIVFDLDGKLIQQGNGSASAEVPKNWKKLGRIFVVMKDGAPAGFVTEGETQGYKNKIRFFVAIDSSFEVAGVRVVEHEEDPGLGAEVATPWFQSQFVGRNVTALQNADVTRDPMPEDWSAALRERDRSEPTAWRSRYMNLLSREGGKPIYAVTGATISSRALTNGVRVTAHHFEKRWALLSPYFGGRNEHAD